MLQGRSHREAWQVRYGHILAFPEREYLFPEAEFIKASGFGVKNHQGNKSLQQTFGADGIIDATMTGAGQFDRPLSHGLFAPPDLSDNFLDEIGRNHSMAVHCGELKYSL